MGAVALLAWLREQVVEAREGRGAERTRRLDSDAAAVQLVTIHASKGLQYPVVYVPALADRHVGKPKRPLFHDAEGHRCLDVGGSGPDWTDHCRRWADEEAGEWLRLLYVALTRAQSQVVAWWAPTRNAEASPLPPAADAAGGSRRCAERRGPPGSTGARRGRRDRALRCLARPRWSPAGGRGPGRRRRPVPPRPRAAAGCPGVHPHRRRRVAAHVVLRAEQCRPRHRPGAPRGGQRARGRGQGRRGGRARGRSRRAGGGRALADGGPAGRRDLRLPGARGPGARRPRRRGPARGVAGPRRGAGSPGGPSSSTARSLADALVAVLDSPLGPLLDDSTLRRIGTRDRLCEFAFEPAAGPRRRLVAR
ncbi:3'-5' exonuclease [Nocardioides convexus]|uniref:3'-5' exonuclease n=1 Tax=Nocardioides convexus TaxID=2712224 RepID=UPI0024186F71|nr:3'-5' exonuclease [Nocardioides convexus]